MVGKSTPTENLKLPRNHLAAEVFSDEDGHFACHLGDTSRYRRGYGIIPRIQRKPTDLDFHPNANLHNHAYECFHLEKLRVGGCDCSYHNVHAGRL